MRLGILLLQIMAIIGRHQRQPESAAKFDQPLVGLLLFGKAVFHDFDEVIPLTENCPVLLRRSIGLCGISPEQMDCNFAMKAGAQTDQPLMVCLLYTSPS